MARLLARALLLAGFFASVGSLPLLGQDSSFATDSGLVQYLRRTDPFFRQLGECHDARLTRSIGNVERSKGDSVVVHRFTYSAMCELQDSEGSDCQYRVDLSGTLDTDDVATIRRFRADLVCYA